MLIVFFSLVVRTRFFKRDADQRARMFHSLTLIAALAIFALGMAEEDQYHHDEDACKVRFGDRTCKDILKDDSIFASDSTCAPAFDMESTGDYDQMWEVHDACVECCFRYNAVEVFDGEDEDMERYGKDYLYAMDLRLLHEKVDDVAGKVQDLRSLDSISTHLPPF